ncbi:MAG TPA: hypothetical protein VHT30_02760 [Acidimicrobiales bacterium]|nr:hypothetical protein [Acidimicrobiales bacterium]
MAGNVGLTATGEVHGVIFDIGGVLEVTPTTGWQVRWAEPFEIDEAEITRRLLATMDDGAIGAISLGRGGTADRHVPGARQRRPPVVHG